MIHDRLKEIYDEFDHHCCNNNIDYSIDADYYNVQGYRLLDGKYASDVLRHMANYVKDRWVDLEYDGFAVNYDDLKNSNFNITTYNPLFKFTLKPIQESKMLKEDAYKSPNNAHGLRQAAFPSSFRKHKTRDTYEGESSQKKKKKKKSLDESSPFEARLDERIDESISMVEPEILFTRNDNGNDAENWEEELKDNLESESKLLTKFVKKLEESQNEYQTAVLESLIENCSKRITLISDALGDLSGTN